MELLGTPLQQSHLSEELHPHRSLAVLSGPGPVYFAGLGSQDHRLCFGCLSP
jgi:hypothetical protein